MWSVAFGFRYVLFWMEWLDSWSGLVGFGCWFLLLFLCFCWVCLFGFCVPRFWWWVLLLRVVCGLVCGLCLIFPDCCFGFGCCFWFFCGWCGRGLGLLCGFGWFVGC